MLTMQDLENLARSEKYKKAPGDTGYFKEERGRGITISFIKKPFFCTSGNLRYRLKGFFTEEARGNAGNIVVGKSPSYKVHMSEVQFIPGEIQKVSD